MSGVRGDARKRQQGEHLTHWDAGVRAVIEREVAKAKAEALREAADQCDRDAQACPDGCTSRQCQQANRTTAAWLRARADVEGQ